MSLPHSITLGLWPIAGVTTIGVTSDDAVQTIQRALDRGVRRFDTAMSYGLEGESDRHLSTVMAANSSLREEVSVSSKVGQRYEGGKRVVNGRPEQLIRDAHETVERVGLGTIDLMYLHCPDPEVPLEESADAMSEIRRLGLAKRIGICNVDEEQLLRFHDRCHCEAIQCPLNLMQAALLDGLVAKAASLSMEVHVFWTLMKGLLAGKIGRDHQFKEGDSRPGYDVFQGEQRARAHRLLDHLKLIASGSGFTIPQLSIGWVLSFDQVTTAVVGARRPDQIDEIVGRSSLDSLTLKRVEAARREVGIA